MGYRAKMSKSLEAVTRNPGKRGKSDAQSLDTEKRASTRHGCRAQAVRDGGSIGGKPGKQVLPDHVTEGASGHEGGPLLYPYR